MIAAVVTTSCLAAGAAADPLDTRHPDDYYWFHGGLTLLGFTSAVTLSFAGADWDPRSDSPASVARGAEQPPFSEPAARLSDQLLLSGLLVPWAVQLGGGCDLRAANASLIYAETQAANVLLVRMTKLSVRRPRPYVHATAERIREYAEQAGPEAYRSFYSGHSSTAFASAMAGSLLFAERSADQVARHVLWGFEFSVAAATANLRVMAGRHHRSDVLVGAVVGTGLGLAIPAAHGVKLGQVAATEWVTAATSTTVVWGVAELLTALSLVESLFPRQVQLPATPNRRRSTVGAAWIAIPTVVAGGGGIAVVGPF
jgi:membrane-associated phospholipid phosphatase